MKAHITQNKKGEKFGCFLLPSFFFLFDLTGPTASIIRRGGCGNDSDDGLSRVTFTFSSYYFLTLAADVAAAVVAKTEHNDSGLHFSSSLTAVSCTTAASSSSTEAFYADSSSKNKYFTV